MLIDAGKFEFNESLSSPGPLNNVLVSSHVQDPRPGPT